MSKKLIYFTSFIFVLGLVSSASAELVAHWKFDEGSGDIAFDSSGNNYHAHSLTIRSGLRDITAQVRSILMLAAMVELRDFFMKAPILRKSAFVPGFVPAVQVPSSLPHLTATSTGVSR
jgi:hypothetical protein